jgi:hypothetical protein
VVVVAELVAEAVQVLLVLAVAELETMQTRVPIQQRHKLAL